MAQTILRALADDLAALQADGLADARGALYEVLLMLGTIPDDERETAVTEAVHAADALGSPHLRILARLLALPLLPARQRETAAALVGLLNGTDPDATPPRGDAYALELLRGRLGRDGRDVPLTDRNLALLAVLASRTRPVPTSVLTAMLTPDLEPRAAANALKVQVHRLRARAGNGIVTYGPAGYALGSSVRVDLHVLSAALSRSGEGRCDDETRALLEDAAGAVAHEPVTRAWHDDWACELGRRIDRLRAEIPLRLAQDAAASGDAAATLRWCDVACGVDPLLESAHELRVETLVASGRHAEAIGAFRAYREALSSALGAEPSPALVRLVGARAS